MYVPWQIWLNRFLQNKNFRLIQIISASGVPTRVSASGVPTRVFLPSREKFKSYSPWNKQPRIFLSHSSRWSVTKNNLVQINIRIWTWRIKRSSISCSLSATEKWKNACKKLYVTTQQYSHKKQRFYCKLGKNREFSRYLTLSARLYYYMPNRII